MTNIKRMTRRTLIKIISFAVALFFVTLGLAMTGWAEAANSRRTIEYGYREALDDLGYYAQSMAVTLEKGVYSGTNAMFLQVADSLSTDAAAAKACLARLPQSGVDLTNTYRFLAQVGDYAMSLTKKVAAGGVITPEEWDSLAALKDYAAAMAEEVEVMRDLVLDEDFIAGEVKRTVKEEGLDETAETEPQGLRTVGDGYDAMESGFDGYPSLIYDGPFSDHLLQETPKLTEGLAEVGEDAARAAAAAAAGVDGAAFDAVGEENGNMPAYCFSGGTLSVAVTKAGGFPIYMTDARAIGNASVGAEKAVAAASDYLEALGYAGMRSTYYMISENTCTVNFAWRMGAATVYTDLIKVCVALDDCTVCGFDARGYIMNHDADRTAPENVRTREACLSAVSPLLAVKSARTAVIPTQSGRQAYCYEYNCRGSEDEKILVYVNAETGAEEQILLLSESENGTLTF